MNIFIKIMKKIITVIMCILLAIIGINFFVKASTNGTIIKDKNIKENKIYLLNKKEGETCQAILVLGCSVKPNGQPSNMLEDRIKQGVKLYNEGLAPKIIMSGDHGSEYYNEVKAMKDYAIKMGVPSEDILMDHAGFSTYESMYRAKHIFDIKSMIVVTQKYHLFRSIYVAKMLGIKTYGYSASIRKYPNQMYYNFREILARNKDFFYSIAKPLPTYLGEKIDINSNEK